MVLKGLVSRQALNFLALFPEGDRLSLSERLIFIVR
jgi:hypothetical protein